MLGTRRARKRALGTGIATSLAILAGSGSAHAFSTRIHIMLANDIRKELIASGGNSIALKLSGYSVTLSEQDARAIRDNPLEFRAGAVGPDNTVFPGMTDPSHALHQQPYAQCQLLYDEALTDAERAYALGCFLHGSTDAIAHHYVNFMSGETFTLTPISAAREDSWDNVVRHIVAESQIQKAAYDQNPSSFGAGTLAHTIPQGFVLRTYFGTQNPLWLAMSEHARGKFNAARAANPNASLVSVVNSAGLAAADHLALAPFYIDEIDRERLDIRLDIETRIAELQDPNTADGFELGVTAGGDGQLGTPDDQTDCDLSCPVLFSTYKTYVALLTPRFDANNQPLPSAFDKLSEKLHDDLYGFMPAYAETVAGLSTELNSPLTPGSKQFSLSKSRLGTLMQPMKAWASNITTLDYETVAQAVLPQWYLDLQSTLETLGINIPPADIIRAVFDPIVQPIRDTLKDKAIDLAEEYVGTLIDELEAKESGVLSEYDARLDAAADPQLGGTFLESFFESGLYAHSFNIAAATFADHRMVVPATGDTGPASFDASHTPAWMQPGVCDYLRPAVFPLGIDANALFSVRKGDVDYPAQLAEDSPVECHSGSLSSFAQNASTADCSLVDLDGLILDPAHQGSLSRAFPPSLSDAPANCLNLDVPGLPDPPEDPSGGAGGSGGTGGTGGGGANGGTAGVGVGGSSGNKATGDAGDDGGCGCRTVGEPDSKPWPAALLFGAGLAAMLRRRRRR